MYNTITNTNTYTKIDIRKTFEGFEAELLMIVRRTGKWTIDFTNNVFYDILKLAEEGYLKSVDIVLTDINEKVLRANKYVVNSNGTAMASDRAGGIDWTNIPDTHLIVLLTYTEKWEALTKEQKVKFQKDNGIKCRWTESNIDNTFPHLTKSNAQLFASNSYELQKQNYR